MSKRERDPSSERIESAQCYSLRQTQVSKRRKETKGAKTGSSQGSLFESSRNVEITEGQLNSIQGHQANLTINFNQYAENDCLEGDETEYPSDGGNSRVSAVMDNEGNITPIWNLPPLPVRRSCDIYYRHLAAKGRGSPMWEPEPSSTLPDVYRRRGITVGDVGIITASGGFDFMFNVCFPSGHPINEQSVPDGFLPIFPPLWARDIRKRMAYNTNSYLASESVVKSQRESDSSEIAFESSASEGAILTMPQGAHTEDLANVSQFRQYFSANAESWYRYINNIRGREAKNGDVRLVIGCDKTSSWGMATFSNSTAQDFRLKFKPTSESGSTRTYEWEYSAMVDARVGPDPEETEEMRSTDESGNSSVYKNQCLFVRTLNATLRDDVWKGLGLDCETAMDIQFDSYANPYGPGSSSTNSSGRSPNSAGPSSSNSTTTGGSTRPSGITSLPWMTLPPVLIENLNTALTAHPSKTINAFMLMENPRARIAITRDDDWISLVVESDQRLPPPDELINRMLATHDVCEAGGMAFLQLKSKDQSTTVSFKQSDKGVSMPPIPLGCRFVPYDQWFITHIPHTWKIRHLKQHILAKCLNLPWDARKIVSARDAVVENVAELGGIEAGIGIARGSMGDGDGMGRPLSPILGNETGDDDAEVAVIPGGKVEVPPLGGRGRGGFIRKSLSKFASSSSSIPFSPISAARTRGVTSLPTRISQPYGTRPDEQIHITGFTMVRFTTGQILEDDHSIAWYQLAPHELVELHGSRPQRGFSVAVQLAQLLEVKRGPGGVLVLGGEGAVGAEEWWEDLGGEETKSPGGAAANKVTAHGTSTTSANNNNNANPHEKSTSTNTATATTAAAPINPYSVVLTSLARHDLNAYIQPYWEGWVQCLRVAWRPDTVSSGIASGVRGVGPYGVGGEDVEEGGRGGERKKTDRQMEWQERWVVIRDGWVYLCKKRDDPNPHRIPLAGLLSLEGVEHLQKYQKDKDKQHQDKSQDKEREKRQRRERRDHEREKNDRDRHRDRERRTHRRSISTPRASASAGSGGLASAFFRAAEEKDADAGVAPMPVYGSVWEKPRERDREREREREKDREKDRRDKEKDSQSHHTNRTRPDPKSKSYIPFTREEAELAGMRIICAKFKSASAWEREQRDSETRRAILRARTEGGILAGVSSDRREGAMASMASFGSTSTLTLAGGGGASGFCGGGGEKERERKYTSTGPSLAAALASFVPPLPGAAPPRAVEPPLEGARLFGSTSTLTLAGGGGGDWGEKDKVGSSLSRWLGGAGKRWGRGLIPTVSEDKEEWELLRLLEKMEFAPMPAKVIVNEDNDDNDGDGRLFSKSMVSIPTIADSPTLHDLDYMEPASPSLPSPPAHPTTTTPTKPKLRVSTSGIGPDAEIHTDSDSCSVDISSLVFAHGTDSEDDDASSGSRYRYGGYHAKEKEKEKEKVKTKDMVGVDKPEEKPDTPAASPVQHIEGDRGEWVILDMGNDHAFNSLLRLFHRHFPPPMSSTFVSDVVEERPLSPAGTVWTQNPTKEKPSTKPAEEKKTLANEDEIEANEDDDDTYHTAALPHPPVLDSIHPHLPNPLPLANPALPYPEWRMELVHRARRHGMREEGRALDLALHGWRREFEEMEQRSGVFKRRRGREEEVRRKARRSFVPPAGASGQRDGEGGGENVVDPKRMSEASHASTINAACMNAASRTSNNSFREDEEDQEPEPRISKIPSSSSSDAYTSSRRVSIDTFLTPSDSSSDSSSSESETEWVAWHTDLSRQRIALQAAKRDERERERERHREQMWVIEDQERGRMHQILSLERPHRNPFAGNSPLEDELNSPRRVVRVASASAASLNPSVHPSISSNSSSDHQLPPRTQEEERRRYLEARRALEPSANSHITITTTRSNSSAAPSISTTSVAFSSSSSYISNQHQQNSQLRLMGSTLSLGSSGRSASPSSIASSNVHAHGLRPSTSFHSQSQQRRGYRGHVRSPSGLSGRDQVFGMPNSPSVESFGGNWTSMGSGSIPSTSTSASVSVSNSPSLPSLGPSWVPRTDFSTAPNSGAISIGVNVVSESSSSVSAMAAPPGRYPPHSSTFGAVMESNSGRPPSTPNHLPLHRMPPSGMRSPTTPTATWNANVGLFSSINSPPLNTNAYATPSSSSSSSSTNPNTNINPQIQPSHPSAHGVHPEEETDDIESLGSVAGAVVLGDSRGSGGRSKGTMMERIARGLDSGF